MSAPIFPHQKVAYHVLWETARVFFNCAWEDLPIRPRFSRFIVGPTGTGKTHMVSALADELNLPLYQIVATNWIPLGSSQRGAKPTWLDLVEFCRANIRGIILLDEVDKLLGWASWMQFIRTEAFSLIEGRVPDNVALSSSETDEEDPDMLKHHLETARTRLADSFLVVGAGAFQHLWQEKQSTRMGFDPKGVEDTEMLQKADLAKVIPAEVVNRFASPILFLHPLQEADYRSILEKVLTQLKGPLKYRVDKIAESSIHHAVDNQIGCRWIEEVVLQALIETPMPEKSMNFTPIDDASLPQLALDNP